MALKRLFLILTFVISPALAGGISFHDVNQKIVESGLTKLQLNYIYGELNKVIDMSVSGESSKVITAEIDFVIDYINTSSILKIDQHDRDLIVNEVLTNPFLILDNIDEIRSMIKKQTNQNML